MATRRGFLGSLLAASAVPMAGWADAGSPKVLAAARDADGSFALYGIDDAGERSFRVALPGRGHAGAAHPTRPEAVAFARRPGRFALVLDCLTGSVLAELAAPSGCAFNGHGCFSPDGTRLFTCEQVLEGSAGQIGIWQAGSPYRRIGAFATGGIGPHELRWHLQSGGLVVANGGIDTDPADRSKLNLDSMAPSLVYLSPDGRIVEQVALDADLQQNSIRHLAIAPDGMVACALQWEGDPGHTPPLLALHRQGQSLHPCAVPPDQAGAMQNYAGSIAFDISGETVALSSPKGGVVQVFSAAGRLLYSLHLPDVCGIAARSGGFLLTDGHGGIAHGDAAGVTPMTRAPCAWDNHIVPVAG